MIKNQSDNYSDIKISYGVGINELYKKNIQN